MVRVKDLQDVVDELKGEATKRANDLFGEGKTEVRRAVGAHSDGAIFGTLALGLGGMPSSFMTSLPSMVRSLSENADAARISSCTRSQRDSRWYIRGDRAPLPMLSALRSAKSAGMFSRPTLRTKRRTAEPVQSVWYQNMWFRIRWVTCVIVSLSNRQRRRMARAFASPTNSC